MILAQKRDGEIIFSDASNISFQKSYDAIVAGLGTAGAVSLNVLAKNGLKALGVERLNCLGGMTTAGAVMGYYFGSKGGYFEQLDRKAEEYKGSVYTNTRSFNAEAKKYVFEQAVVENNAEICYETVVTGVFLEDKKIKGVRLLCESGFLDISCMVLIDCTGDAEVCALAGCSVFMGREIDGQTQPFSSVRVYISNEQVVNSNFDCGKVDQTTPQKLSDAIITSHSQHLLDKYENSENRLLYLASLLGIRDGRHIVGEEMLKLEEFLFGKETDEPVFYAYADIDKHGSDNAMESEVMQEWFACCNLGALNVSIPIPLGIMIPKGYSGLLTSGRCMSLDADICACVRMERDMQKAGEVAAVAASLAINKRYELKNIPYGEILTLLKETGCFDENNNVGFQFDNPMPNSVPQRVKWLAKPEEIKEGLASSKPGVSLWSVKRLGVEFKPYLVQWLTDTENENLKKHSAIALALINQTDGAFIIRKMIKERDCFILKDCRKNNQLRGYIAIYCAGKIKDREIVDELIDIVCNPLEVEKPIYHNREFAIGNIDPNLHKNLFFQYFSFSVMALIKISETYPDLQKKIYLALKNAVENGEYIRRITKKGTFSYEYIITDNIKKIIDSKIKN